MEENGAGGMRVRTRRARELAERTIAASLLDRSAGRWAGRLLGRQRKRHMPHSPTRLATYKPPTHVYALYLPPWLE